MHVGWPCRRYQALNVRLRARASRGEDMQRYVTHEMPVAEQRPYAMMCALQKWMSRPALPRLGLDPVAWACPLCPPCPPDCEIHDSGAPTGRTPQYKLGG